MRAAGAQAFVAELDYALRLGRSVYGHEGSSPSEGIFQIGEYVLAFQGDIHGSFGWVIDAVQKVEHLASALIQVGDWGVNADIMKRNRKWSQKFKIPVYFIDGNHEHFELLPQQDGIKEMMPNVFYVPRGEVLVLDGKKIAFLGGAASIDKEIRIQYNYGWDIRENILPGEVLKLYENVYRDDRPVDIFVSHVPPVNIIKAYFSDAVKEAYGKDRSWQDPNSLVIQEVWGRLGNPPMFCGHMHRSVGFGNGCRILGEAELKMYPNEYEGLDKPETP